jgi:hypothetical protein
MFKKGAIIAGNKSWKSLTGEIIRNRVITIQNIDNYFSKSTFVGPFIFNSSIVKVQNCNKNFIRYNLEPHHFPNIKFLYLNNIVDEQILSSWDLCTNSSFIGALHPDHKYILEKYKVKYPFNKWIVCNYN